MNFKKISLVTAGLALVTTPILSKGTFKIAGRSDYVSKKVTGDGDTTSFQFKGIKAIAEGDISSKLSYALKVSYSGATKDHVDGTSELVDYAYLKKKFSDKFNFYFGKQFVSHGGNEYDYDYLDIYQYSLVGNNMPLFRTGANFEYMNSGQKFHLQFVNPESNSTSNTQRNISYGAAYYGSFVDGMIVPRLSYQVFPMAAKQNKIYMAAGVSLNVSSYTFESEYLSETLENTAGTASNKDTLNTSAVFLFRYNGKKLSPFVKHFVDKTEADSTTTLERSGTTIAIECGCQKNFRWHLAFTDLHSEAKSGSTTSKTNSSKIYAGIKFAVNIL